MAESGITLSQHLYTSTEANKKALPLLKKYGMRASIFEDRIRETYRKKDITVLLTNGADAWKSAYGSFCMAAQAGLSVAFMYKTGEFKKAKNYIIPCVGTDINLRQLPKLMHEIEGGANVLITYNGGHLGGFEKITGLKVLGREGIKIGEGYVYFLNCAPEGTYSETYNAQESSLCEIYRYVFASVEKPNYSGIKFFSTSYTSRS